MTAESAAWVTWLQPSKLPSEPGEEPVLPTERVHKHATVSRLGSTMNAYLAEPTPERTMKITVFNLRAMIPQ